MDEKQAKTLKRVIKKLNALRKTLTKPERAVLDAMIVREAEVTGHAMTFDAASAGAASAGAASAGAASAGAANAGAASAGAASTGAATVGAVNVDVVAHALISLAATGYVVELR